MASSELELNAKLDNVYKDANAAAKSATNVSISSNFFDNKVLITLFIIIVVIIIIYLIKSLDDNRKLKEKYTKLEENVRRVHTENNKLKTEITPANMKQHYKNEPIHLSGKENKEDALKRRQQQQMEEHARAVGKTTIGTEKEEEETPENENVSDEFLNEILGGLEDN